MIKHLYIFLKNILKILHRRQTFLCDVTLAICIVWDKETFKRCWLLYWGLPWHVFFKRDFIIEKQLPRRIIKCLSNPHPSLL